MNQKQEAEGERVRQKEAQRSGDESTGPSTEYFMLRSTQSKL